MRPEDLRMLKKYDHLLQEYANQVMLNFPGFMENQRQPFNPFFKKLFDFYLLTSFFVDSKLFPEDEKIVGLRILYAKASLAIFGILSCLQNGLSTEGAILLRSLFETYLNVKLVLEKDTDARLKLFDEYRFADRWNNLQANRRLLKDGKITQETFERTFTPERLRDTEEGYSNVKTEYHPTRPYHWAWKIYQAENKGNNPSVSLIADKLNLSDDYVKVYGALSISGVHTSPNVQNIIQSDKGISLAPNFTGTIYTVGCLAVVYMAEIIEDTARYFKFGEADEIPTYVTAFALNIYDEYKDQAE